MAKFSGMVGIKEPHKEISPGIYDFVIKEIRISGDIFREGVQWSPGELAQDTVNAGHTISVIATQASVENLMRVVYVIWNGQKWSVKKILHERPRIKMTLGGIYNE